jgi:hypothetical protein
MSHNGYIPLSAGQILAEPGEQGDPKFRRASGPTILQTNDPRFNPPTPSPLKRVLLLLFVFCLFWFALRLRTITLPRTFPVPETERCFPHWRT